MVNKTLKYHVQIFQLFTMVNKDPYVSCIVVYYGKQDPKVSCIGLAFNCLLW